MDYIHSTLPFKPKGSQVEIIKAKIKQLVIPKMQGKKNAIKSGKISEMIGIESKGTHSPIRQAMKELMIIENIPIIGCSLGFYVALSEEEVLECIDTMERRKKGIERDIEALQKHHNKFRVIRIRKNYT